MRNVDFHNRDRVSHHNLHILSRSSIDVHLDDVRSSLNFMYDCTRVRKKMLVGR